jgi:hypothetical protein
LIAENKKLAFKYKDQRRTVDKQEGSPGLGLPVSRHNGKAVIS